MVKIKILGSSSGVPTKKRYPASILLSIDKDIYLLDCGDSSSSLLVRNGVSYNKIKSVFISHMDPDHSSGIFMLIQLMELTGRRLPLKVFVPQEAVDGLNKYLEIVYLFKELLHFNLEILPIKEEGFTYRDKNLTLSAYLNNHLKDRLKEKYPHLKLQSYSFLLEAEGKRIVYSGDVSKVEDLEPLLKEDIELLISEIAHFKPEELFKFLLKKKVKKIILTHIHPDLDNREDKLVELGNKYLGRNKVSVAYDGLEMEI